MGYQAQVPVDKGHAGTDEGLWWSRGGSGQTMPRTICCVSNPLGVAFKLAKKAVSGIYARGELAGPLRVGPLYWWLVTLSMICPEVTLISSAWKVRRYFQISS